MFDPFDTLGLPRRFELDEAELHRAFIRRSAETHPDRFADPLEQADAAERAAEVNAAYRALKDPHARAQTLLGLLGADGGIDEKALSPDLLMQVMEIREEMDDAVASGDRATLDRIAQWARDERSARLGEIRDLFRTAEQAGGGELTVPMDPELVQAVKLRLNAIRYFQRTLEQMPA